MRHSVGCRCCSCTVDGCPVYATIGYELSQFGEIIPNVAKTNIATNIGDLADCQGFIVGHGPCGWSLYRNPFTSFPRPFPDTSTPNLITHAGTINSWISTGGRMLINAEYLGCMYGGTNITEFNYFLQSIGANARVRVPVPLAEAIVYDCDCDCKWKGHNNYDCHLINGEPLYHACTTEIVPNGATVLSYTQITYEYEPDPFGGYIITEVEAHVPWLTIEPIGDGWLMVCGDGNMMQECEYNNCGLWKRYFEGEDIF